MIRLETVEDFEKVNKALNNPNSKPFEYIIRSFGFCSRYCRKITEFYGTYNAEICYETCYGCGKTFSGVGSSFSNAYYPSDWYITGLEEIDIKNKADLLRLNSREVQKLFFNERLEIALVSAKSNQRKAKKEVRRLAKLRI